MIIGVPIVTCPPRLYQQCTHRQKQSKTVKRQWKQQKSPCTNRYMSIQSPPYTKSASTSAVHVRVRRIHKALRRASTRLAWYRHMPASSSIDIRMLAAEPQWRRQNVKTARSFPGQYGRKAANFAKARRWSLSMWLVSQPGRKPGQKLFSQGIWPVTPWCSAAAAELWQLTVANLASVKQGDYMWMWSLQLLQCAFCLAN